MVYEKCLSKDNAVAWWNTQNDILTYDEQNSRYEIFFPTIVDGDLWRPWWKKFLAEKSAKN